MTLFQGLEIGLGAYIGNSFADLFRLLGSGQHDGVREAEGEPPTGRDGRSPARRFFQRRRRRFLSPRTLKVCPEGATKKVLNFSPSLT